MSDDRCLPMIKAKKPFFSILCHYFSPKTIHSTRFFLLEKKTSDFNQDFANAIAQMFIHYHQLRDPLVGMGKCFMHDFS